MPYPFEVCEAHETWRMEEFSSAYVRAVSATAGCSVAKPEVDDDSIDLILKRKRPGTAVRSPQLDIQLKATYTDCIREGHISYPLSIKNYDEFRPVNVAVPRILVVVAMNPEAGAWIEHSQESLSLRKCGYWISLRGEPPLSNTTSRTVAIPREQVFDAIGLHRIFEALESGRVP
jgi:hypothetical protein